MKLLGVFILLFLIDSYVLAQTTTYTTAGANTWTCPAGVTSATIECWGGGGGGGSSNNTTSSGGSGGGGGAYSKSVLTVSSGTYYLSVGTGGTGAPASSTTAAQAGGDTWFNIINAVPTDNTGVLAKGGGYGGNNAGSAGIGGSLGSGFGTSAVYSGGNGGVGGNSGGAGGGSSAGTSANGVTATSGSGTAGAVAPAGGGDGGAGSSAADGVAGSQPGGGGGGGNDATANKGGNGAVGKVVITWPTLTIGNNTVGAANVCPNALNVQLHGFTLTGTSGGGTVTGLTFVTTGTYVASDISNFKLYYTTTSTFATTNLLATISSPTAAGTQTFPAFSCPVGTTTIWFWITMDLYDATTGNTIAVNGTQISNITETGAELKGGPSTAGGTQTFLSTSAGDAGSITAAPGALYICAGQSGIGTYTVSAISGATGYIWTLPTGASIATGANTNSITVDYSGGAVSGNITVNATDGTCAGRVSPNLAIGIMDVPTIVTDPESTYGCNGTSLTFSVVAIGAGLTYQWQENGGNLTDGGVYSGVTTETLTISDPTGLNGRTYRCVVTGQCASATSASATLNVLGNGLSGTKNIPGDYATLQAAFTDINNKGLIGNLYLRIGADITETGAATLNQWNSCGNSGYTVTIYPTGATRTISGTIATSLVILNGADYVTFDGRIDMTGTPNSLILSNLSTSGSTLKFIADATYNSIKYCTLKGVSTAVDASSTSPGVVWFSTGTTTGNDYNTISDCDIRDGSTNPAMCIYSEGTAGMENDNNIITRCNIYNFYLTGNISCGIMIGSNNKKWTISYNSLFQQSARTNVVYVPIRVIDETSGNEFIIEYNQIGGSSSNCGGSAMTITNGGVGYFFYGIQIRVTTSGVTYVRNNTIKNISWTGYPSSSSGTVIFAGMTARGRTQMNNNTIGDNSTGSLQITVNDYSTSAIVSGIFKTGDGDILNNTIGSFSFSGSLFSNDCYLYSIFIQGSLVTDLMIYGNTIGNSTTANSIQSNTAATPSMIMEGIYFGTSGNYTTTVSNNLIANISDNCTNSYVSLIGIQNNATAGKQVVIGNTIRNLTALNTNTAGAIIGIDNENTTTGNLMISHNSIHSLSATAAAAVRIYGILNNGSTSGVNIIKENFIHSFNTTYTLGAYQVGILHFAGTAVIKNNMVRLGIDKDGNSVTSCPYIAGIWKYSTSRCGIYFNTSYIGGTGVTGSAYPTYAFYRDQTCATAKDTIENNIFYNARSRSSGTAKYYAYYLTNATNTVSNYNSYYISGTGGVLGYVAADKTTTAQIAAATAGDAQSLVETSVPLLVAPTANAASVDLHLQVAPNPPIGVGLAITNIAVDFDGEQRKTGVNPNGPCIGADERIAPPLAQNSYGVYIADAQNGIIADCEMYTQGGTPGGIGYSVFANSVNTNYVNVNVSDYQVITQENIQCTNTDIDFTTATGSPDWLLGNGSSPSSGSTTPITTQYTSTGRKDIIETVKVFKDFTNLTMETPSSGSILGAPAGAGCPTTYNYISSVAGSAGFTYSWSASTPGGCEAIVADPTGESTDITFVNTTGYNQVFTLYLDITSECCGPLRQVVRYITVWPAPLAPSVTDAAPSVCTGGSQTISVSSPDGSYAYNWYDVSTGGTSLGAGTSYTVSPVSSGTDSYWAEATNSYGCSSDRTEVVITGNDTPAPGVTSPVAVCGSNDAVLNVTAPTAGYAYNWYSGSCAPTGTLLQTGSSSVYTTVVSASTTIYVSQTPPGCGASTCASITLNWSAPPDPIVWLGNVGGANNWFNTSNWTSGCLPTCETNVSIPVTANNPDIGYNAGGEAETKNINLQNGVTLSFSDTKAVLSICGDFTHAGNITTNDYGKIIFNSSTAAQNYTRTGTGDLNSIKVNNTYSTPTVTINSNDMVLGTSGVLEFLSGLLVTGSNKVIVKNTNADAVIGQSVYSYVNGTLRRYVSTDATNYFHFPVGTSDYYEYSGLKITSIAGASPYIDVFFTNPNSGTTPTGISLLGTPITTLLDYGFWTLTPTNITSIGYDITLTSRGHTNGGSDPAMHTIVKRANGSSAWATYESNHSNSTQSGTGSSPITAVLTNMTTFSDAAIARGDAILPIDLISFSYVCVDDRIIINWITTVEENNDYFILQRSFDGTNFEPVAIIMGAGNSTYIHEYSYSDFVSSRDDIIYKLYQVDFNGKIYDLGSTNANCNIESNISIFNPINDDNISISISSPESYKIRFYDQLGRVVLDKSIVVSEKNTNLFIDKKQFAVGIYNIVIQSDSQMYSKQVIINRN